MLIEHDYKGHRIEVTAQLVEGAWDAEVASAARSPRTSPMSRS